MANKYCNLDGSKKIKDEYQKINIGFDKVEEDVNKINDDINALDERVDEIITTPVEDVSAEEIIDARGGRPVLGKRFEDIEVELAAHKDESAPHSGHLKKSGDEMTDTLILNGNFPLKINGRGDTKQWAIHRTIDNNNLIFVIQNDDGTDYDWGKQITFRDDGSIRLGLVPVLIIHGAGSPEGTITARPGSIYLRYDGGVPLYVKATGTGNTGWKAVQVE